MDPDRGTDSEPLSVDQLERLRRESGLADVLPGLRGRLVSIADDAAHIMVVVDAAGRVLWRDGSSAVRRRADGLGFVEGASWEEGTVGTNAIGTALIVRGRCRSVRRSTWCAPTTPGPAPPPPVHDPRDGRVLAAAHPGGRTATELATDLFGDPARIITVRAEMSRLRRHLGGVLEHRPYRFNDRVQLRVLRPTPTQLLTFSTAPAIRRVAEHHAASTTVNR